MTPTPGLATGRPYPNIADTLKAPRVAHQRAAAPGLDEDETTAERHREPSVWQEDVQQALRS
jgi:hypothetical protein